jgi:hypothetical protein
MEHEVYINLVDHEERLTYIEQLLVKEGLIPKPKKEEESEIPSEPEMEETDEELEEEAKPRRKLLKKKRKLKKMDLED